MLALNLFVLLLCSNALFAQETAILDNPCPQCGPGDCVMPYMEDCQKYISCKWDTLSQSHIFQIMNCAFGTFYNRDEGKICDHSYKVKCPNDPCKNSEDGSSYKNSFGCRSYWTCQNQTSIAHCCSLKKSFSKALGGCYQDDACRDYDDSDCGQSSHCEGAIGVKGNCKKYRNCTADGQYDDFCCPDQQAFDSDSKTCVYRFCNDTCQEHILTDCRLKEVATRRDLFLNNGIVMNCGKGTLFSKDNCTCIHDDSYTGGCLPIVDEPFESTVSQDYYSQYVEVDTNNSKATFGVGSYIPIYYFHDTNRAENMYLSLKFTPKSSAEQKQALVASCDNTSPLKILLDTTRRQIRITAQAIDENNPQDVITADLAFDYIPHKQYTLTFKYSNNEIVAVLLYYDSFGQEQKEQVADTLPGTRMTKWHAPMYIGGCPSIGNSQHAKHKSFVGDLNSMTIYHGCIPGEPTNLPQ